jgi:hypothetical protein
MSFEISKEDKKLIKLSAEWMKSRKDKCIGEYLLEQIINKYMYELMKEDSRTLPYIEELEYNFHDEYDTNSLSHLNLIRKCKAISKEMGLN